RKVVVVEKLARPGGALKRFRRNGIAFDVGFHATGGLGKGEILSSLWSYCGALPDLKVIPFPEESCDLFEFDDFDRPVRAYFAHERYVDELLRVFPREREAVAAYFRRVEEVCATLPFYHTELPLTPYLRTPPEPHRHLVEYLAELTSDPILQAVLAAPLYLYGVPSREASFEIHAQVIHGYHQGTYVVDGGGQAVVDAFLGSLKRLGVDVVTGETVNAVVTADGRVAGLTAESGWGAEAGDVVHTGHPADLLTLLPESLFRSSYRRRLRSLEPSASFFMLFGAAARPPDPEALAWTNWYRFRSGLDILPAAPDAPPKDRGMMLNCPGRRDVKELEANRDGVILFEPAYWQDVEAFEASRRGSRPQAYREYKERLTDQMLATAKKNWGHLCGDIEPLAVGTPLTFRDELSAHGGAAYGASHGLGQRTPYVRTKVPGLWLSGQSTLMTGIISASLAGMVTAGEMVGLEELWEEVREC
ncbi:MAG: NAD(P)/FAD-dependent oxidoreductase, partial [Deltaproteobacteria bacterium]|nr:NAD(P)/FAD-dependent oxidoreductase [Deltaproteobacteria bacterium]